MIHHERFDELRLGDRCRHLEDGFVGEHRRAFGDSVDTARESEAFEMLEKPGGKTPERVEVDERRLVESQRFQVGQHVVESARQQQVAPRGKTPHEQAENGLSRHALVEIGLEHR